MSLESMMMDTAVQMSINMTAKIYGIEPDQVTKILQVGLPAMGKAAQENPDAMKQMYAESVKMMPENMQAMYGKMAEDPAFLEGMQTQYKTMFGAMTESVNRIAAEGAGVDEETAGKVLGASMPAFSQAFAKEAPPEEDEKGFGHRLGGLFN